MTSFCNLHPEDGGSVFFLNDGKFLPDYVARSKNMLIFMKSSPSHTHYSYDPIMRSSNILIVKKKINPFSQFKITV